MADDDPDEIFLAQEAFQEIGNCIDLHHVEDGEELIHYLRRSGKYAGSLPSRRPKFILLDLNMPRKDGVQALLEIKADPDLKDIPVVVWTTSDDAATKIRCQGMGADDFVTKPSGYDDFINRLRKLVVKYFFMQNERDTG